MSTKYPGGLISKTAPTPSGPYADSSAPGVWTLEQQAYWVEQGNWPTAGNVNPDAFIENLFQTWLYTGNGSTQTITNGIDLAGEGGMVWQKDRTQALNNRITDTVRGATKTLITDATVDQQTYVNGLTSFNSNGFSIGTDGPGNNSGDAFVSWTFRKQPKFFDIVTYTGNGTAGRTVAHNLGSVPGCIIIKNLTTSGTTWCVYHKDISGYIQLQSTSAASATTVVSNVTSTSFDVAQYQFVNGDTESLVAYLFAHNAGGFGLSGTDNVISCGSFTTDGSGNASVNLGYEPQWILTKAASGPSGTGSWYVMDNMRGLVVQPAGSALTARLLPNSANAEAVDQDVSPNATGFTGGYTSFGASTTYIYIAIRRGPMKVPTDGTSVYNTVLNTGNGATKYLTGVGFPPDMVICGDRDASSPSQMMPTYDKLRGNNQRLKTTKTDAEDTASNALNYFSQDGFGLGVNPPNLNTYNYSLWSFRRAPGFFDEVCYTGTGSNLTLPHNLTVAPELVIAKVRSTGSSWGVSTSVDWTKYLLLNSTNAQASASLFGTPDATNIYPTASGGFSGSGNTYVAYLFATCPGVSKVGSYTGTATTLQINCGFTAGARFVLIKRTDSTGDWYVWDSARGIVAGNDPYLLLNSTAAEVTSTDYVDTYSAGFEISSTAPSAINASGGTFIFLAIA